MAKRNRRNSTRGKVDRSLSIEERAAKIIADVPDKEWKKLPLDFNENLDHYLYGARKRK
jgi:hypothetical protein